MLVELQLNGWMSIFSAFSGFTKSPGCDTSLLRFEVLNDSVDLLLFLAGADVTDQARVDVDVAYSTIRWHSRKSRTQAFPNVL